MVSCLKRQVDAKNLAVAALDGTPPLLAAGMAGLPGY